MGHGRLTTALYTRKRTKAPHGAPGAVPVR